MSHSPHAPLGLNYDSDDDDSDADNMQIDSADEVNREHDVDADGESVDDDTTSVHRVAPIAGPSSYRDSVSTFSYPEHVLF